MPTKGGARGNQRITFRRFNSNHGDEESVLREDKGREPTNLVKNSLEDLLEIDQVHKMIPDDTRDGRFF